MSRTYSEYLVGQKFNRLTVLKWAGRKTANLWHCICDCGNESIVATSPLKTGSIKSCGCYMKERASEANTIHGLSKGQKLSREFNTWSHMKGRCYNPSNRKYYRYGARGIKVCDRWLDSFENFLADMGAKPSPKHSIDRINNDGNYEPSNCRWATAKEQSNNKSSNILIEKDGMSMNITAWEDFLGWKKKTLANRLRLGWDIERAFNQPIRRMK